MYFSEDGTTFKKKLEMIYAPQQLGGCSNQAAAVCSVEAPSFCITKDVVTGIATLACTRSILPLRCSPSQVVGSMCTCALWLTPNG
jgi:hypothetical protein